MLSAYAFRLLGCGVFWRGGNLSKSLICPRFSSKIRQDMMDFVALKSLELRICKKSATFIMLTIEFVPGINQNLGD